MASAPGTAAQESASPPPAKTGKRRALLVALALVVLIAGAGAAARSKLEKHGYAPGDAVKAGQLFSLGALTVNTADGHLAQAAIDIQLSIYASQRTVGADSAALKNAAIDDISNWTYPALLKTATRTVLQHQLLISFQHVLGTGPGGAPEAIAVYFTSFLLQ